MNVAVLRSWTTRTIAACGFAAAAIAAHAGQPPRVLMQTSMGTVVLQLDPDRAPQSVANFLAYVRSGFYDGLIFSRVERGYVVQGGGYDEQLRARRTRAPIPYEGSNGLLNKRGTIAMARGRKADSAMSQFFINLADNTQLDGNTDNLGYAVFGRVVDGMPVMDRIGAVKTGPARGLPSSTVPITPIVIQTMRVIDEPASSTR